MADLIDAWRALFARLTPAKDVTDVGRSLITDWGQAHRKYHNVDHLRDVLANVDELADNAADADLVRLAAWYHDAVYNGRHDDEEKSARRAESELSALGLESTSVCEVVRLIRLTASHNPGDGDRNGETLCDSDLAILGMNPERYDAYTKAIRSEYAHVTDPEFRRGRAAVLEALLAGPKLFRTPIGEQRWEAAARINLATELRELTSEMEGSA
ncbi:MAG: metal-dependent phosphohydrolase [Mycobacterium sp.]|uniref:HD domain-containing protein n=2 Tax=Mycobacterium sp. TaxID=1785 RepID=UPI003C7411AD